ncbi:MAG: helix-turn-helix transcriptional regulator [Ruminococcaceae bacterium]|nr:helix-turn-helix transcriptional regulator [Oscillospiraceae bacterium]
MNISKPLYQLMQTAGISRSRLARELGVHTSTVTNWLEGKAPKSDNLTDLARFFAVPVDYFTPGANPTAQPAPPPQLDQVYFSLAKQMQSEGIHPDDIEYFIEMQRRARQRHDKG